MLSFNFNGKDSFVDYGIIIKDHYNIPLAKRNIEMIKVRGMNGSLKIDDGTYDNITIDISCMLKDCSNIQQKARDIKAWLAQSEGKLVFSDESDKYYIAQCINQIDITQTLPKFGEFLISFECYPFAYAVSNPVITLNSTTKSFNNLGTQPSEPIIKIYGTGDITFYLNSKSVFIIKNVVDYVTIDSYKQDAYKDTLLKNNDMIGDFPKLLVGNNTVNWTGTVTKVEITCNSAWI